MFYKVQMYIDTLMIFDFVLVERRSLRIGFLFFFFFCFFFFVVFFFFFFFCCFFFFCFLETSFASLSAGTCASAIEVFNIMP